MGKEYDKVKKGLDCCVGIYNCCDCPYHGEKHCVTTLLMDAKSVLEKEGDNGKNSAN